jgi:hypothetical protein
VVCADWDGFRDVRLLGEWSNATEKNEVIARKTMGGDVAASVSMDNQNAASTDKKSLSSLQSISGSFPAVKPPVWPDDDDDDDFIAKKNAAAKVVISSENNNLDEGETSQLQEEEDRQETKIHSNDQSKDLEGGDFSSDLTTGGQVGGTKSSIHANQASNKENTPTGSIGSLWGETDSDTNPIGLPDNTGESIIFEPVNGNTPTSSSAYHRNESDEREENIVTSENQENTLLSIQDTDTNEVQNDGSTTPEGDIDKEVSHPLSQFCQPATNCMECISLSIDHLRANSEPCYWVGRCISAGEANTIDNAPSGAYKCAEDGSPIFTGEDWNAALNVITSSQVPMDEKRGNIPEPSYYDEYDDEDGFFENVKFTFNVILLAAVVAVGLLIRKRVNNRLRDDSSLEMAEVVKEEFIRFITSIVNYVKNAVSGSGSNSSDGGYRPITTNLRSDSFERQDVPLSTIADEEWGWDDENTGPNLELPAVGADDDAKEEEELALAIAMSLSESTNGSSAGASMQPSRGPPPKPAALKPKATSPFASRLKDKKSPRAAPKPKTTMSPAFQQTTPPLSQGDSIEDLLGQMNSSGGEVITRFGQKPQTLTAKPKPAPPQKKDSVDDMFASMGFSNSHAAKPPIQTAPRSAPLPSKVLMADNDDDDADWGDEDLDDLLGE